MTRNQRGVGLVELMISMAIGIFIIGGVFAVYLSSKDSFRTGETINRLQEDARFGIHVLSEAIALAGFLGRNSLPYSIEGRGGIAGASPGPLSNHGGREPCAADWHILVDVPVDGANNTNPFDTTCLDNPAEYAAGTDVLVLKFADAALDFGGSANPMTPAPADNRVAGTLYVRSNLMRGELYRFGTDPDPALSSPFDDREWHASVYYLRPYQGLDANNIPDDVPTLRRLQLQQSGGGPALIDEEVLANVEDFQVHLGQDDNGDGSVDRWINPVRFWLLIRAENVDHSLQQNITYTYADVSRTFTDGYRRTLVERTVELRNPQTH